MRNIISIPLFYNSRVRWLENHEGDRTSQELSIIKQYIPIGSTVVEAGCGYGRIVFPLLESGYIVYAFDGSQGMLDEMIKRRVLLTEKVKRQLHVYRDDLIQPRFLPQDVDAILFLWGTFANIPRESQSQALNVYVRALKQGGIMGIELPAIDVQEYQHMTEDSIEVLDIDESYGVVFNYYVDDVGVQFSVPNKNGMSVLSRDSSCEIIQTHSFVVHDGAVEEQRIFYILKKK